MLHFTFNAAVSLHILQNMAFSSLKNHWILASSRGTVMVCVVTFKSFNTEFLQGDLCVLVSSVHIPVALGNISSALMRDDSRNAWLLTDTP